MGRFVLFSAIFPLMWLAGTDCNAQQATSNNPEEALAIFRESWQPKKGYMRPLNDEGWQARMRSLTELMKTGKDSLPILVKALDDPEPHVRAFAAQALSFIAKPGKTKLDQVLAKDKDAITRLYVADALGTAGGLKSTPLYQKIIKNDPNRDVKAHMSFALERKGRKLDKTIQKTLRDYPLKRIATAKVGKKAPDFTLVDTAGKKFTLSDFRGKKRVVLIFIYGDT